MTKLKIPHDAIVLIGDGRKALFMRNRGDEKFPDLRVERVLEHDNPPTREQGSDQPGRAIQSYQGPGRATQAWQGVRSGMEEPDWHRLEEERFARDIAAALEKAVRTLGAPAFVIVAPARTLAELRRAVSDAVRTRIVAEVRKDLTKHPVGEIERHLTGRPRSA
ncbi:MAG TPA: host attachment family protein [Xanthobacteraceae bacterium]